MDEILSRLESIESTMERIQDRLDAIESRVSCVHGGCCTCDGHTYGEWRAEWGLGVNPDIYQVRECLKCDDRQTRSCNEGHHWRTWIRSDNGDLHRTCTLCGMSDYKKQDP